MVRVQRLPTMAFGGACCSGAMPALGQQSPSGRACGESDFGLTPDVPGGRCAAGRGASRRRPDHPLIPSAQTACPENIPRA